MKRPQLENASPQELCFYIGWLEGQLNLMADLLRQYSRLSGIKESFLDYTRISEAGILVLQEQDKIVDDLLRKMKESHEAT